MRDFLFSWLRSFEIETMSTRFKPGESVTSLSKDPSATDFVFSWKSFVAIKIIDEGSILPLNLTVFEVNTELSFGVKLLCSGVLCTVWAPSTFWGMSAFGAWG